MNLVSQVLLASWVKNLSFPGPGGPSCCSRIVQSTEGRKPTKISGFFSEENLNRKRIFAKQLKKRAKDAFVLLASDIWWSWSFRNLDQLEVRSAPVSVVDFLRTAPWMTPRALWWRQCKWKSPGDFLCSIRFQLGILCMNLVLILRVARVPGIPALLLDHNRLPGPIAPNQVQSSSWQGEMETLRAGTSS